MSKAVSLPIFKLFVASGIIATFVIHPIHIIKVRINHLRGLLKDYVVGAFYKIVGNNPKKITGSGKDRLGELPDDVVSVILSYLTLKEAGRSSVISRKWKHMWTLRLTPSFNFDATHTLDQLRRSWPWSSTMKQGYKCMIESKRREYITWVNHGLVENPSGPDLDEFILVFHLDATHSPHLDKWISFAVKRRVKTLKIDLFPPFFRIGDMPYTHMASSDVRYSLTTSALILPGIECLSSLDLRYVNISGETVEQLLLACPLLERLSLFYATELLNFDLGPTLKLKHLVIVSWHIERMKICAPKLVSLQCWVPKGTYVCIVGLISLSDLNINVSTLHLGGSDQFSKYASQLEILSVRFNDHLVYRAMNLFPQFINLKHLTIKLVSFPLIRHTSYLTKLINSLPLLHKFTLECSRMVNNQVTSSPGDSCSHQYLKVVEIARFTGQTHDIQIAEYFLRIKSLEKLIIDTQDELYDEKGMWQTVEAGSREEAQKLTSKVLPGVKFLII